MSLVTGSGSKFNTQKHFQPSRRQRMVLESLFKMKFEDKSANTK